MINQNRRNFLRQIAACSGAVALLPTLSAERVCQELMRLLALPDPFRALGLMRDDSVLAALLPEATRLDRLERLVALATLPRLREREMAGAGEPMALPPPQTGEGRGGF